MAEHSAKICLITGAAGGIGRTLVDVFMRAGFDVLASDNMEKPEDLVCTHYIPGDLERVVDDEHYAQDFFAGISAALAGRPLQVLINNAAIQVLGSMDVLSLSDLKKTMSINLYAPFLLTKHFLSTLERGQGCVVNIGSIHSRLTKKEFVAYATSKAALAGMTRAMAVDLGPRIRVNAIEPAAIETPMLKAGFEGKSDSYRMLAECHPQQRIGTPVEVAELTLCIATGQLDFLHGACLAFDGGIGNRLFDPE